MPRRRSPSSDSAPRKKRSRKDSRSRSRGRDRGGRGGDRGGDRGAPKKEENLKELPEWGKAGVIQDLKPGGIGFIRPDSGKVEDKDLFFHKSALTNGNFDELQIGEEVTYVAVMDAAKSKAAARNITLKIPHKTSSRRDDSRDRRRR
mmetsp:Transcript_97778/g.174208  ORF Transcript_97778/g.174208 Transcript_97778/m.174208 type:complete len:147 (+) Transcript_97778:47-487(+)